MTNEVQTKGERNVDPESFDEAITVAEKVDDTLLMERLLDLDDYIQSGERLPKRWTFVVREQAC